MATALFQCSNEGIVDMVKTEAQYGPARRVTAYPFGSWLGLTFHDKHEDMYCWCMDLVPKYASTLAFIGVDAMSSFPDDPYKLVLLTSMPEDESIRNGTQQTYFVKLLNSFLDTRRRRQWMFEEILTICQRCVLGPNVLERADYCARILHHVLMVQPRTSSREHIAPVYLIDNDVVHENVGMATMCRAMAHICYLCYRLDGQIPSTLLGQLKYIVFGR